MPDASRLTRRLRSRPAAAEDIEVFKRGLVRAGIPLGGPEAKFAQVGRKTLAAMIDAGLLPTDQVLDVGAGSMRIGWWLLHYIEPRHYHALEPLRERIDTAARLLGADINVYDNDDFTFPDVAFDFVIARSVWTHASKGMMATMIAEFARTAAPGGAFLASMRPAGSEDEDYAGDEWVGKGVDSDEPGMVRHSLSWVQAECDRHGLTLRQKGEFNRQTWVLLKAPRGRGPAAA
jgi:hypothetical protein